MATGFNYLPQSFGGAEVSTDNLCQTITKAGHSCAVACALAPTGDSLYFANRLKSKLFRDYAPSDHRVGYPVFRGWQTSVALADVVRKFKPDVTVIQSGETARLVNESLSLGSPTVVYLRDVEFDNHGGEYKAHPALRAVANSNFTANAFTSRFGIEAEVLPPSLDRSRYYVPPINRRPKYVLFVNPHPSKGLKTAVALARSNPDIPFLFLKSWRLDRQHESLLANEIRGLENVEVREPVDDMRSVYAETRLVLVPSVWGEAWCRVVSEAQVSGIPAIASMTGGLPESVGEGGLLLEDVNDMNAWSMALRKLWRNPEDLHALSVSAEKLAHREILQPMYTARELLRICSELL